ncbi:MAG: phosphoheptose isomerase [Bacteroidota bacterium]|nr:phosphoheptose isomerase [Bacteroidota bacterium]
MELSFNNQTSKEKVFSSVKDFLEQKGFSVTNIDKERPWGGFFVIDETQSKKFKNEFFKDVEHAHDAERKISPKILVVEANKRLSWQYHYRRSEIWKLIGGEAGIVRSNDDNEKEVEAIKTNEIIFLKQGERHRLIGLNSWGIIAEIWQHTDAGNPSDEDDIVRVQDDFGR